MENLIESLFLACVLFTAGFFLGQISATRIFHKVIVEILQRLNITEQQLERMLEDIQRDRRLDEEVELPIYEITVEQHAGELFAYSNEDNSFLAQGTTREELFERIAKRINGVTVRIREGNGAELVRDTK